MQKQKLALIKYIFSEFWNLRFSCEEYFGDTEKTGLEKKVVGGYAQCQVTSESKDLQILKFADSTDSTQILNPNLCISPVQMGICWNLESES